MGDEEREEEMERLNASPVVVQLRRQRRTDCLSLFTLVAETTPERFPLLYGKYLKNIR